MFTRDPKTKEELLDRILRYDFEGDVRQIGAEPAQLKRTGANELELTFPRTGRRFRLTVHRPREEGRPSAQTIPSERSFASTEPEGPPQPSPSSGAEPQPQTRRRGRQPAQVEHTWSVE